MEAKLIVVYGDALNEDNFKEKVGAASIKQLARTAKERRLGAMGYAEAMILEYNGKKKNSGHRLAINKLYSKEIALLMETRKEEPMQQTICDLTIADSYYDLEDRLSI